MKRLSYILCLSVVLVAACGEETRNGQLTLTGSAPLKLLDQSGKVVEFLAGPTEVTFAPEGSRKFKVTVKQGADKQAAFSGQAPSGNGWNFTLRGQDIGQQVDMASDRKIDYVGQPWRRITEGAPCGYNGRWVVEEEYQTCNEGWRVDFTDSATYSAIGAWASQRDNLTCFLSSRNLYCRDYGPQPPYHPIPPHPRPHSLEKARETIDKLNDLGADKIKFD